MKNQYPQYQWWRGRKIKTLFIFCMKKTCKTCLVSKSEENYYKNPRGYFSSPHCKSCLSIAYKKKYKNKKTTMQEPLLSYQETAALYQSIYG